MKANSTPSKRKDSPSSKKAAVGGGDTSSQGIRATEAGGQKKVPTRINKPGTSESRSEHVVKRKVRTDKRPSVAASKVAANAARTSGVSGGSGGIKRKPENHTLQSNSRHKKPRKFR